MNSVAHVYRRVRRAVLGRRRLLAAIFAALAVGSALRAIAGPPPPTEPVLIAARDLPSGSVLRAGDLREVPVDPELVPAGALERQDALGRTTAAPMRAGEPLTDVRLVQASMLRGYPGLVAAPVRLGDADAAGLLRVGDRVDLLAADPAGSAATVVASNTPVVAIPARGPASELGAAEGDAGALLIVAVREETARSLAQAGVSAFMSMVVRR